MRVFLWIVILIGTPFYIVNEARTGVWDSTTTLILLGFCVLSVIALVYQWRKMQAAQAQQDFWRSQRK
jgi:hypothetical protein